MIYKDQLSDLSSRLAKQDCVIIESSPKEKIHNTTQIEIICANNAENKITKICQGISKPGSIRKIKISNTINENPSPQKQNRLPSRLVPLQKQTLAQSYASYVANKERINFDHDIASFAAFVNYCVSSYLPIFEEKIKEENIMFAKILN